MSKEHFTSPSWGGRHVSDSERAGWGAGADRESPRPTRIASLSDLPTRGR